MRSRRLPSAIGLIATLMLPFACGAETNAPTTAHGAYTRHDYVKSLLAFNHRTLVEPYKQIGKHDPRWDDDAIKFLEGMALRFANAGADGELYILPGEPKSQELIRLAESARGKGCDDPMVAYCYAAVLSDSGRGVEARPLIRQASQEIMKSRYPLNRAMSAALREFRAEVETGGEPATHDPAWAKFRDSVHAILTSWDFKDIDRRIIFHHVEDIFDDLPTMRTGELVEGARTLPGADPWLVNMLDGRYQIQAAWEARTSNVASMVTPEGWKGFFDHLVKARDALTAAWKLRPDYPESAGYMITVAMGGESRLNEDPRQWFDRAVAAQIDYQLAYDRYLNTLLPRWGGSTAQMHQFALDCLNTNRFDTDVPWKYAVILEQIAWDLENPQFWQQPGVYENVAQMCAGYRRRNPPQISKDFYSSYEAAVAWRAGHYEQSRKLLNDLNKNVNSIAWRRMKAVPKLAMAHADLMASDPAPVQSAETQAGSGQIDGAVAAYQVLAPKHVADRGGYFIKSRLKQLQWQKEFEAGDWVDVQPADAELLGWGELDPAWSRGADGALVATPTDAQGAFLVFEGLFGRDRFEVEAQVEFPEKSPSVMTGLFLSKNDPFAMRGLWLMKKPDQQFIWNDWRPNDRTPFTASKPTSVRLSVFEDQVMLVVNEQPVVKMPRMNWWTQAPKVYVGLGCRTDPPGGTVKFTKLRLRKLTERLGF